MGYSFAELRDAWVHNRRLGTWNGLPVLACTKEEALSASDTDNNYYIVFNDGNALVHKGQRYGTVSEKGNVDEWRWPMRYGPSKEEDKSVEKSEEPVAAEFMAAPQETQTSSTIEEVLTHAREMTVDSLLEGFNYGVA